MSWHSCERYLQSTPLMATTTKQDNVYCQTTNNIQECFGEYDKEPKAWTWTPNSPEPNPVKHSWDVPEVWMDYNKHTSIKHPTQSNPPLKDPKELLLMVCSKIWPDNLRGALLMSLQVSLDERNRNNIR